MHADINILTARLSLIPLLEAQLQLQLDHPELLEAGLGLSGGAAADDELRDPLKQMLAGVQRDPEDWPWYTHWLIIRRRDRHVVGGLCFKGPPGDQGTIEVGYGLNTGYCGRGYMSEALGGLMRWAAAQPGVKAILAETETSNLRSHRVLQRIGFLPDEVRNGMLWWRMSVGHPATPLSSSAPGEDALGQGQ